ncbi:MAG: 16S rRNA (cytosine(1402)-N(4))-methyltransferase RsmH [Anaerolineaceae bacterium]|nr:16S rRNA (cytosine(1402)-N(4))-methyltransferase RsmH [Anaerolineaceae bacterium]MBN2676455.1 16S rRNA (cytosine(1402)-N(4))-methyltransferase RsmH [Anaerolineaceae bacterium]
MNTTYPHLPVLYQEILTAIQPKTPGLYVDCTLGAGGHARGILEMSSPGGQLLGFDLDPAAITIATERLKDYGTRAILVKASYTCLSEELKRLGWQAVQGVVLDLGVSSMQFDQPERGFSFREDAPLDMRFNPDQGQSAAILVNKLGESELADILWRYGEERYSRRIARAIVANRPVETTRQLAELVKQEYRGKVGHIHPATRTFQALRIAVNGELEALEAVLPQAVQALAAGGRLAVISFHSLEDRLVKQYFQLESKDCICPPEQPLCTCSHRASLKLITKHPLTPSGSELDINERARSAKLRVAEKL